MTKLYSNRAIGAVRSDRHGQTVGRVFQAQILFAVFKSAFNGPATSVGGKNLAGVPVKVGAVEHLIGPLAFEVACQDDGQEPRTAGLVIQGLLGFDLQAGMQSELVEGEFGPGLSGIGGPFSHAGQTCAFLASGSFALFLRGGGGGA